MTARSLHGSRWLTVAGWTIWIATAIASAWGLAHLAKGLR